MKIDATYGVSVPKIGDSVGSDVGNIVGPPVPSTGLKDGNIVGSSFPPTTGLKVGKIVGL